MALSSGFYNALNINGAYDRKYNANDFSNNLAAIISTGVRRSGENDMRVTAAGGMSLSIAIGRAWIEGRWAFNDSAYTLTLTAAPASGKRIDRIVLRDDSRTANRTMTFAVLRGTAAASPVAPALTRSGGVYEIALADVLVNQQVTTIAQGYITDKRPDSTVCGWVTSPVGYDDWFENHDTDFNEWFEGVRDTQSSVTLFKQYTWSTILAAARNSVTFNIPQYSTTGTDILQVYVNGNLELPPDYTVSGNTITWTSAKVAGTEINIVTYKSIDGTGLGDVSDEITVLQNQVADLVHVADFNYNGINSNDNHTLSDIAQALLTGSYVAANVTQAADEFLTNLGGNTYLAALASDAQITIHVSGKLGVSSPYSGSGTSVSRYKWFSLGADASSDRKITFDFADADRMLIYCATNTENIIFYGTDLNVKNVSVHARCAAANCLIQMIAGRYNTGDIYFENCRLTVITTGKAMIAQNGTYVNCDVYCSSSDTHSLIFQPASASLIRVFGGTYRAYTASFASVSAIFYTYGTETDAVVMAYNINCPQVTVANFYQHRLAVAFAGKTYINGVVTTLESEGSYREIVGAVAKNKP